MKKSLVIILKIVLFLVIYIGAQSVAKYMLLDDMGLYTRSMINDIYTSDENIDVLFCGASHCQLGVDFNAMNELSGKNTFNAASSAQGLETTLALIKETAAYHDLEQVYVDLDYSIVLRDTPNLEGMYLVTDYLKWTPRKLISLLNATDFEYYVNSLMPLHKGRGYVHNPKEILAITKKKLAADYRKYVKGEEGNNHVRYVGTPDIRQEGTLWTGNIETRDFMIPEKQKKFIQQMITFCKKNDINITFISIPTTDFLLKASGDYDQYINNMTSFLNEYGEDYYDFNLCNPAVIKFTDAMYSDDNHLNMYGADTFDKLLMDFENGKYTADELFCNSYAEKLSLLQPGILGLVISADEQVTDENYQDVIQVKPIVNGDNLNISCSIEKNKEKYLIQAEVDGVITNTVEVRGDELR